jgi:predicted PurR-regulated permease PerM
VRELVRTLEDDERAAQAFFGLLLFGVITWFATFAVADTLLPLTTLGAFLAVVFGVVGWRAAKQGVPREASTLVGLVLAAALSFLWIYLIPAAFVRLLP